MKTRLKNKQRIILPTEPTEPAGNFSDFSILIHGEKKIGKTDLANQGGKVLFLQFDPPQKAYRRIEQLCTNWKTFVSCVDALEEMGDNIPYDRVVVDGVDRAAKFNEQFICDKLCIEHPSDLKDYGKTWGAVRKEFQSPIERLLALPCGCWFIAHSAWEEIERRNGSTIKKLLPILGKMPEEVLTGLVDAWFAYDYVGEKRVLYIEGTERIGAGHRMDQDYNRHFRTPDGQKIHEIPMGEAAGEGYKNIIRAFQNKQTMIEVDEERPRVRVRAKR